MILSNNIRGLTPTRTDTATMPAQSAETPVISGLELPSEKDRKAYDSRSMYTDSGRHVSVTAEDEKLRFSKQPNLRLRNSRTASSSSPIGLSTSFLILSRSIYLIFIQRNCLRLEKRTWRA